MRLCVFGTASMLALGLGLSPVLPAGPAMAQVVESDTTFSCDTGIGKPLPFTPSCREEAPGFEMRGPEFDEERYRATWVRYLEPTDEGDALIYVADVDPITGVINAEEAETILSKVAPPKATNNGPEWADSQRGPEIFFSCANPDYTRPRLCRINADFSVTELQGTTGYSIRSPAKNASNPVPKIYYEARSDTFDDGEYVRIGFAYRADEENFEDKFADPDGFVKGGRWMPDGKTLIYSRYTANSETREVSINVFVHDTERGGRQRLFNDGRDRINARAWEAPELGGKIAFMATLLDEDDNDSWDLAVYRQVEGFEFELWTILEPICPETFPNSFSPEPFVFEGRSYVSGLSVPGGDVNTDTGTVWVKTVDPDLPQEEKIARIISANGCVNDGVIRKDPEGLPLQDAEGNIVGARVYYTVRAPK